jgi:hypothetical protein
MSRLAFVPITLFGSIVLVVVVFSAIIDFMESRRAPARVCDDVARRARRAVFRPVIIQGGKAEETQFAPDLEPPNELKVSPARS